MMEYMWKLTPLALILLGIGMITWVLTYES